MTYDEAIEILQRRKLLLLDKFDDFQKISEATDLAIQSLDELIEAHKKLLKDKGIFNYTEKEK